MVWVLPEGQWLGEWPPGGRASSQENQSQRLQREPDSVGLCVKGARGIVGTSVCRSAAVQSCFGVTGESGSCL